MSPDPNPQPDDEVALISAAKQGDADAVEQLLAANLSDLNAYIKRRLGDKLRERETSQDLAQSVCREALGDLGSFEYRGSGSFKSWLLGCAENKLRKRAAYWDRDQRTTDREERQGLERLASFATPSQHMTTRENLDRVERAFAQLPADYREVILLARVDGLTYEQTAEKMGRTHAAVQNLLCRALARLTSLLR